MRTSDNGITLIKAHEGLRLDAYPDAGYGWARATIGYGHTSAAGAPAVVRGMRITASEADAILRRDLQAFEAHVRRLITAPLSQNQFDALVSFTVNLGPGNLESSTLRRKLNAGDYAGAADQFAVWNMSNGRVLPGLTRRRAAERTLFLTPDTRPAPKPSATPAPKDPANTAAPFLIGIVVAAIILFAILS